MAIWPSSAENIALSEDAIVRVGKHEAHPTQILARFAEAQTEAAAGDVLKAAGVKVIHRFSLVPGLVVLDMEDAVQAAAVVGAPQPAETVDRLLDRIQTLRATGLFAYVEPDYIVRTMAVPNDSAFNDGTLWGLRNNGQGGGRVGADINAEPAWDITTGSSNVIVAVIDTGIRYTHQDLIGNMWRDPTVTNTPIYGTNAAAGTLDPFDDNGHGTHVAGTIGATANDGKPHVGVAWRVQLMGCKFLTAGGFGQTSHAIGCVDYAVANGAHILNNSWGGGPPLQALQDSIVAARNQGVLFVAAAGNSSNNNDRNPAYPASYQVDNIIAVAALDRRDLLADFSNYGRTNVHVGAPGVEIFSCWNTSDSAYNSIDGTSMACPHVAGVAALIRAQYPQAGLLELRERILLGVQRIPALNLITTTGGRVDAFRSLTLAPDGQLEISITPANNSILLAGSTEPLFVRVTDVLSITNANVVASAAGVTNITLLNTGVAPDVRAGDAVYSANFQVPTNLGPLTMVFVTTAPGATNATNIVNYTIVPRPPNDDFVNASKIAGEGTRTNILSNNRFASIEPGEPMHARVPSVAASLWWNYSPAASGRVFVDTSGSSFDTVLAVYTGNNVGALTEVASVDDVGARVQGYLSFTGTAGQTYRIAVSGYDTNQFGALRLRVEPNGNPDTVAPVVTLTSPPSGSVVTNRSLGLVGTALDPVPNASGVSEVQVRVNDDPTALGANWTNGVWTANVLLREGDNTFEVVAMDFAGNQSVTLKANAVYRIPDPLNDLLVNAATLSGVSGNASGRTTRATKESGEPNHAGNQGGYSIWWKFQAPANGVLELNTEGSDFDTLLAVYTGDRISNLVPVGSNDDAFPASNYSKLALTVVSGQTYRIAIDGYGGTSGDVALAFSFVPAALYQVAVTNTSGGQVSSTATGAVASNTVVRLTATPDEYFMFAGWEGTLASTNNPLEITVTNNVSLNGRFVPRPLSDGFEQGDLSGLSWVSTGAAPWTVQSGTVSFGQFAARSGDIGHNQRSSLLLTARFEAGPASFQYRVSSEANFDTLKFLIDGVERGDWIWSGKTEWVTLNFIMPAGEHTLEWRYAKDAFGDDGDDAAYLDNVDLPLERATVTLQPVSLVLIPGETASFEVAATGNPPLSFRWQKNGIDLVDGTSVSGSKTATLTISPVVAEDAGAYTAIVTSPGGSVTSEAATLTVMLPPTIVRGPENLTLTVGGSGQFTVQAEGMDISYQWQKDGTDLPGATAAQYNINGAQMTDAGTYAVRVSNRAGSTTASATLTVNEAAPVLTLLATGPGQLRVLSENAIGLQVQIRASGDLVTWETIGTITIDSADMPFTDPEAASLGVRFYRAQTP